MSSVSLRPILQPLLPSQAFVLLDVGCGMSTLGIDLYQDSLQPCQVICMDISRDALLSLQDKANMCKTKPCAGVQFLQADILQMPLQAECVDVVLDKGTTDTLLKDEDSNRAKNRALSLYKECLRVLKPSGRLFQITDEDPELRFNLLDPLYHTDSSLKNVHLSYKMMETEGSAQLFVYTIQKANGFI